MFRQLALTGALALAVSACAAPLGSNSSIVNDALSALAVACPALSTAQGLHPDMTGGQQATAANLALACPPNPAPNIGDRRCR